MTKIVTPATSPHRRCTKNQSRCIVPGCDSKQNENLNLSFHKLPKKGACVVPIKNYFGNLEQVDKLKAWENAIKVKNANQYSKVCSLHFKKEDYIFPDIPYKIKTLQRWAVPSMNLPCSNKKKKKEKSDLERNARQQQRQQALVSSSPIPYKANKQKMSSENTDNLTPIVFDIGGEADNSIDTIPSQNNDVSCGQDVDDIDIESISIINGEDASVSMYSNDNMQYKAAQVQTDFIAPRFFLKNDTELNSITGLQSFEILNSIVELVELVLTKKPNYSIGNMSLQDQIILTYIRFKQKISHNFLAVLFNCDTPQECQQIFKSISNTLHEYLPAETVRQPSKEEVLKSKLTFIEMSVTIASSMEQDSIQTIESEQDVGVMSSSMLLTGSEFQDVDMTDETSISIELEEDTEFLNVLDSNKREVAIQVQSDFIVPRFFIKNDTELSTATGLESFDILHCIIELVELVLIEDSNHQNRIMSLKDQIILTYMKLKQNLSYRFLAILFNCYTPRHCQRIFAHMVSVLAEVLPKAAIRWPSKEEVIRNMPHCFEGFEDVRGVVDCTEIKIEIPSHLLASMATYSYYKGHHTFKFQTTVSPAGNIIHVSKAFGGRVSDSAIFEQCGLLDLFEPGDAVMVDRGFLIDELCLLNKIKLIRPPFLNSKKQFSKEESELTAKIARARVHIERSNQRIKNFKILGSTLPACVAQYADAIFLIICATINLSSPILKDDKFF